jgi:2-oxoglutarate dehydrogenase E2 component (dihydrolipoamide succinyltransferase)
MLVEMKVPSPGESITEVTIDSWLKADGEYVKRDEPLAEIQSDKATLTLYAEESGTIKILAAAGETVEVGKVVVTIDTDGKPAAGAAPAPVAAATPAASAPAAAPVAAAPATSADTYAKGVPSVSAQKMMDEKGIATDKVNGTGRDGRITKADVVQAGSAPTPAPAAPAPAAKPAAAPASPSVPFSREQRRVKMTQLRKTLAARLVAVKNETAMLTTFNEVDMSAILSLRKKYKDKFAEKHGVNLGFMSFFSKACAEALKEFPAVNASIDGADILYHDYVDMGIAVSTERGLLVPVIRNADSLSMADIEKEVVRLADLARQNKITIDDMTGGTFTITNGGVFGSLMSTPILNPPQSAILGMHKTQDRAVVIDGKVEVRPMMYLALSYDHRIIDGKESVSFLVRVKEYLEDPTRLLLA